MKDIIIKGTGNSRYMKSAIPEDITFPQLVAMLRAGTFPFDLNGINEEGFSQLGPTLGKETLLNDAAEKAVWGNSADRTVSEAITALADIDEPIGTIKLTSRTDLGSRWILCNGDTLEQRLHPELAKLFENTKAEDSSFELGNSPGGSSVWRCGGDGFVWYVGSNSATDTTQCTLSITVKNVTDLSAPIKRTLTFSGLTAAQGGWTRGNYVYLDGRYYITITGGSYGNQSLNYIFYTTNILDGEFTQVSTGANNFNLGTAIKYGDYIYCYLRTWVSGYYESLRANTYIVRISSISTSVSYSSIITLSSGSSIISAYPICAMDGYSWWLTSGGTLYRVSTSAATSMATGITADSWKPSDYVTIGDNVYGVASGKSTWYYAESTSATTISSLSKNFSFTDNSYPPMMLINGDWWAVGKTNFIKITGVSGTTLQGEVVFEFTPTVTTSWNFYYINIDGVDHVVTTSSASPYTITDTTIKWVFVIPTLSADKAYYYIKDTLRGGNLE